MAENKVCNILRTLLLQVAPIAMLAESSCMPFGKVINSVSAEISRHMPYGGITDTPPMASLASVLEVSTNPLNRTTGNISKAKNLNALCVGSKGNTLTNAGFGMLFLPAMEKEEEAFHQW